jgi:hypothetical protein
LSRFITPPVAALLDARHAGRASAPDTAPGAGPRLDIGARLRSIWD